MAATGEGAAACDRRGQDTRLNGRTNTYQQQPGLLQGGNQAVVAVSPLAVVGVGEEATVVMQ